MIDYRQLIHRQFSDRASIGWDDTGTIATVCLLAEDQTAIALTMPAATLKALQEDIVRALADRRPPTADR